MYKNKKLNNGVYENIFNEIDNLTPNQIIDLFGKEKKMTYFYLYKNGLDIILFTQFIDRNQDNYQSKNFAVLSIDGTILLNQGFNQEDSNEIKNLTENQKQNELFDFLNAFNHGSYDIILIENEDKEYKKI